MKRFLNEKLLIIVFLLIIIFIFPQIIYAAVDGKKEGVTGTYYDVVSKKENKVSVEKGLDWSYEEDGNVEYTIKGNNISYS